MPLHIKYHYITKRDTTKMAGVFRDEADYAIFVKNEHLNKGVTFITEERREISQAEYDAVIMRAHERLP